MYVCCQCKVEMRCNKNSVGAAFGDNGHVYPADRFKCPKCGMMILATNAAPIYDPKYQSQTEYLKMAPVGEPT